MTGDALGDTPAAHALAEILKQLTDPAVHRLVGRIYAGYCARVNFLITCPDKSMRRTLLDESRIWANGRVDEYGGRWPKEVCEHLLNIIRARHRQALREGSC